MTKFFVKILLIVCLSAAAVAAQQKEEFSLPVVVKTEAIADLKPLIAAAKENKKPLLVNFWATWCGPCRVEFPELVAIDADYRRQGLDFRIVSLDNFGSIDFRVADFLKSSRSTMPSYLLDLPTRAEIDRAVRRIAPASRGGLPMTLLFDSDGKLVYQKSGIIDPKILRSKIDQVLAVQTVAENVK